MVKAVSNEKAPPVAATPVANSLGCHITQDELAAHWRVSTATLERWRCYRQGPPYLKLHGQVRYRLADIRAYERSRLRVSTGEAARDENWEQ